MTIEPDLDGDGTRAVRTEALILTHNAPASLQRCLSAVSSQTRRPTAILVLDNASDPPIRLARTDIGVPIRVLRSQTNLGPAGGWAMALGDFLGDSYDWAWVMDDDIIPEPDCLERLLERAHTETGPAFVFPYSKQPDGTVGDWSAWSGFVIAKEIVEEVGVPRAELFWWAEDTEYCKWRIPNAGFPGIMVPDALVHHDAIRHGRGVPTWKYYYETRNLIYLHLHVMRRLGWFPRNFVRLMARAFFREKGGRLKRSLAIATAIYDGIVGRLGIRYPVVPMIERSTRQETEAHFQAHR